MRKTITDRPSWREAVLHSWQTDDYQENRHRVGVFITYILMIIGVAALTFAVSKGI